VGIVGYGKVGSRVRQLYEVIGLDNIKVCDPPLAEGGVDNLCDPAEIKDCDIISLHVPLSGSGPHTTLNMVNTGFLSDLRQGTLLVNTSRGKVTEKQALTDWLIAGRGHAALDVWPEEPAIDPELLERCSVATPHVAGYSLDGKIKGTMMIYDEFCRWLKSPGRPLDPSVKLPVYEMPERQVNELSDAILVACPVQRDDQNLRTLLTRDLQHQSAHFDDLRKDYPERRDFSGWRIPQGTNDTLAEILQTLGFI
jgi:erythronate-4-phosphate dehydrogenase